MSFLDQKQKLEKLLELINKQNTGSAFCLAEKICVSKPTVERYIALLRIQGFKIGYCASRKTYYFIED